MERIETGIKGLDELIQGGFPKNRMVLVSGATGTGKTTFSMQYIIHGAKNGEPGVYITVDEKPESIREDMKQFGFDVDELEKEGKIAILDASSAKVGYTSKEKYSIPQIGLDIDELILKAVDLIEKIGAKRVVLDSIPGLGMQIEDEHEMRNIILKMNYMFSEENVTAIMTSEVPEQSLKVDRMQFSKYEVEAYVADGVIMLHYLGVGSESNRSLFIRKMRGTKHTEDILPMEITSQGVEIKPPEKGYEY
ncbi:MAG: ATPase domain-containing protein [archaeon]